MNDACILAIDQGTTNTKALLVNAAGAVTARASRPLPVSYPQPGWVEQDALDLWRSVQESIDECLAAQPRARLAALAISNQRESVVAWERATGEPVGPCVVWQCRRSAPFCDELRRQGLEERVRQRTGLIVDPMFSAGKARWAAGARAARLRTCAARRAVCRYGRCLAAVESDRRACPRLRRHQCLPHATDRHSSPGLGR